MEIGSQEHIQKLKQGIYKTAFKTSVIAVVLAAVLIVPSLVRANDFSNGLAGLGIILFLVIWSYAWFSAFKKYKKIVKPLLKENAADE